MPRYGWFRMWSEARTDRKLDMLSDAEHRCWFGLLCLAADASDRGEIDGMPEVLLSIECARGDVDVLRATLNKLESLRICTVTRGDNDAMSVGFVHWAERQYDKPSDAPEATRARKSAERQGQDVTPGHAVSRAVTPCHAGSRDVTPRGEERRGEESIKDSGIAQQILTPPAPAPAREPSIMHADDEPPEASRVLTAKLIAEGYTADEVAYAWVRAGEQGKPHPAIAYLRAICSGERSRASPPAERTTHKPASQLLAEQRARNGAQP